MVMGMFKYMQMLQRRKYAQGTFVMTPRIQAQIRNIHGYQVILNEMRDKSRYINYLRMPDSSFKRLLQLIGPRVSPIVTTQTNPLIYHRNWRLRFAILVQVKVK